ncbi:integral membrane protein [Trichophyton equinum CBS 127.97]|uniref:Integral membrane protein n=1 Tax=Trichophyton equinum (strain ATCC MYA-4606 / CBS 127.97) TaxID=559882 RepID=F2PPV5_TRIEC|nr:integral membrane protein [Trichophyton equinum CBS 127.97]
MLGSIALGLALSPVVMAHGDHHKIPDGKVISGDPLDTTLWIHILLMTLAFGLIFPTGMVLGIVRSRYHVPVQVVGTAVAILAYFLGHLHKGRQFAPNIHASFANSLMLMLVVQVVLGVYLKLHIERGFHGRIRRYVVVTHGVVGKIMPLVSWIQMVFGGITALGFCRADHLGQCLAHFIMGSAFIAYGIILTILLLVGQFWLRSTGRSQEFFDSAVITAWGFVNTFTEHRWGSEWSHSDMQHTTMGIIWWCAGLLGMWLSRKRNGRPKRNIFPAVVILLTGYAMSSHAQHLMLSTIVHSVFGYTLMAAGAARIIEISFVLKDRSTLSPDGSDPNSFQYLTPYLLFASGFIFMGATEEQMQLLHDAGVGHVSYLLILYSLACLLFLFVNVLLHIYAVHAWPESAVYTRHRPSHMPGRFHHHARAPTAPFGLDGASPNADIHSGLNGGATAAAQERNIRDAQEFELEGLIGAADKDRDEEEAPANGAVKL